MCKNCGIVSSAFQAAQPEHFAALHAMLNTMVRDGQLRVFAGDCPLEDMPDVLREEKHYTVCFYLECPSCGEVYFFGGCIRSKPIYKRVGNTRRETIDSHLWGHRLWGSEGTYYQSPPEN